MSGKKMALIANKNFLIYFIVTAITVCLYTSCGTDSQHSTANTSKNSIENIELSGANVDGVPLISPFKSFISEYGSPVKLRDSCSNIGLAYKQGFVFYDCLEFEQFPGIKFKKINDTIFINSIDFKNTVSTLNLSSIQLSNKTTLSDIEKIFPNSANNLNKGANMFAREKGQNWLYLTEKRMWKQRPKRNLVEIRFNEDNLAEFIYNWTPSYSEKQWNRYLEVKSELNDR
ncbi:MAG: hypothetical protein AAGA77_18010 [Bacteroidota bacterium]